MQLTKHISRYKRPLVICLIAKIILITFSYFAFQYYAHEKITSLEQFLSIWNRWDAPHYLYIAEHGYTPVPKTLIGEDLFIVFLPFFPALVKVFSFLTLGNFLLAGMFVSILASITASVLLFEITRNKFGEGTALKSVLFLNIFPTSYFLITPYTESVFLALSLAFYLSEKKGHHVMIIITGIASGLTRLNSLLLPALALGKKNLKSLIYSLSVPLGFSVYLLLNYAIFGNLFHFIDVLQNHWHKSFSYPWIGIKESIFYAMQQKDWVAKVTFYQEPIFLALILLAGIYVYKINKAWSFYMISSFILFSSTSFILSTPRYALVLFPIFIVLAKWSRNKFLFVSYVIANVGLLLFFTSLFVQGRWAF